FWASFTDQIITSSHDRPAFLTWCRLWRVPPFLEIIVYVVNDLVGLFLRVLRLTRSRQATRKICSRKRLIGFAALLADCIKKRFPSYRIRFCSRYCSLRNFRPDVAPSGLPDAEFFKVIIDHRYRRYPELLSML